MGIDPQTHKPISISTDSSQPNLHSHHDTETLPNSPIDAIETKESAQTITSTISVEPETSLNPCASSSSSSLSSSSSNSNPIGFEDLEFPDFKWVYSNDTSNNDNGIEFWEDDYLSNWDFLVGHEDGEVPIFQESWPCGLI